MTNISITSNNHNAVSGYLAWILRVEGLAILIAALLFYQNLP